MRTVIFDLDGTLMDTSGDLIAAANACFRDLGHGDLLRPETDKAIAHRGARAMLRAGLGRVEIEDEDLVDRQYQPLLDHYGEAICVHSTFYPGAIEVADTLRARGIRVGIATNKPEWLADKLLRAVGLREHFGPLVGADTLETRKPDPLHFWEAVDRAGGDRLQAVLVGDTETDRETARRADAPSILVAFGPEGRGIERLSPDALLEHFDDLPDLFDGLMLRNGARRVS
ncbi:HAD-IA family hydrolase [Palleronia sp. LCG004]|uniref:HAD-IA family hydrolase n=1 Tax=Palleronia sp. LCG004 TaxID=3079304 RepID=UPI00294230B7|nr:HAD-IA family hydrolase [Palleronia sp. LCG004]WOI54909.1 HAD-IA family hydrolase [Palleronia sp. LCG004]